MAKRVHEPAAFSFGRIAYLGGTLLLVVGAICAVIFAIVRHPTSAQRNAEFSGEDGMPQPRLQSKPKDDFATFRAQKQKTLNEYAWIDKKNGVVRIPIDRAMDIIASRKAAEDVR